MRWPSSPALAYVETKACVADLALSGHAGGRIGRSLGAVFHTGVFHTGAAFIMSSAQRAIVVKVASIRLNCQLL